MQYKYTKSAPFENLNLLDDTRAEIDKARQVLPTLSSGQKFYLPQLDGLRFFAFLSVFISHAPSASVFFKQGSLAYWVTDKATYFGGWFGVDLFLCLSSFLLTTLLLIEYRKTGIISIRNFLARRALRIWPLYYMVLILGFLIFPHFHVGYGLAPEDLRVCVNQHLLPFSVFLGNLSYALYTGTLTFTISPLWTVSLEEQFYLCWPIILFILLPLNKKWFFITLGAMVLFSFLIRWFIIINHIPYPTIWVFTLARLDPFALGALLAYLYVSPKFTPKPIVALFLAFVLYKLVLSSTTLREANSIWQMLFVDVGGCLLIYAAIYSHYIGKLLSIPPLPWLGKISFGLYVFHDMLIRVVTQGAIMPKILKHMHASQISLNVWLLACGLTLFITVCCASASYYFLEKPFLRLKKRFTIIASRPV